MARRPKKAVLPKKTKLTSGVFQGDSASQTPAPNAAPPNPARRNGTPHSGLTTNRSR